MQENMQQDVQMQEKVKYHGLYDWMQTIVMTLLAVLTLLTFVGRNIGVDGDSMNPTLLDGDRMIVRSLFYAPNHGDIVVVSTQSFREGKPLVKRVIALAGEVVEIDTTRGVVYVNGIALDEPNFEPTFEMGDITYPYTVPDGHIFVIGDNRNASNDSRFVEIGPIDEREIIGGAMAVFFPFTRAQILR